MSTPVAVFSQIAAEYFPHSPIEVKQGSDGIIKAAIHIDGKPTYLACYPGEKSMRETLGKAKTRENMQRMMKWAEA